MATRSADREMNVLYKAFDKLNALDNDMARKMLRDVSSGEDRSAKAAAKVLAKMDTLNLKVTGMAVDQWLQVDPNTYAPPGTKDKKARPCVLC